MYEESLDVYKSLYSLIQSEVAEAVDRGYAESGYKGAMLAAARQLAAQSQLGYISPFQVAIAYGWAEERDDTFLWLEQAYEAREPFLGFLRRDPRWDGLRSDPRFEDLAERIGLPE